MVLSFYYDAWTEPESEKNRLYRKRDADQYEREFLAARRFHSDMLFSDLYKLYHADTAPRLRAHTLQTKRYQIEGHILPRFGHMKLSEITPAAVRQWQNTLIEKDFSKRYITNLTRTLSAVFNYAMRYHGLMVNPCKLAGTPKLSEAPAPPRYWSLEEYSAVMEQITDVEARAILSMLYWVGLRKGELWALLWSDIDFDAATVNINKSLQRLEGQNVVTPTKTGISRRVKMPSVLVDELKAYYARLYKPRRSDAVFPWRKRFIEDVIASGAAAAGVQKINVHGLRHSHASLLINQGVDVATISARLGHERISTTLDTYSHMLASGEEAAIAKMDALRNCTAAEPNQKTPENNNDKAAE